MLKCSGVWVSPIEIEAVLIEHPAVQEAAVVGREDDDELLKPAAYVRFEQWHSGHTRTRPRTAGIRTSAACPCSSARAGWNSWTNCLRLRPASYKDINCVT